MVSFGKFAVRLLGRTAANGATMPAPQNGLARRRDWTADYMVGAGRPDEASTPRTSVTGKLQDEEFDFGERRIRRQSHSVRLHQPHVTAPTVLETKQPAAP